MEGSGGLDKHEVPTDSRKAAVNTYGSTIQLNGSCGGSMPVPGSRMRHPLISVTQSQFGDLYTVTFPSGQFAHATRGSAKLRRLSLSGNSDALHGQPG